MKSLAAAIVLLLAMVLTACGPDGGPMGPPGPSGLSSLVSLGAADPSLCSAGGTVMNSGLDLNSNGTLDLSEVVKTAVVCNGTNGTNAPPTPFTPTGIIAPCAADPMHPTVAELSNPALEIFLQLSNGTVLDSFSQNISGYNTHFGVLSNGTYESTGAGNCTFTFHNGVITR